MSNQIIDLEGNLVGVLQETLASIYNPDSFKSFVRIKLNKSLDKITQAADMPTVAFNVIDWAERNGMLKELIQGMYRENRKNPNVKNFIEANYSWIIEEEDQSWDFLISEMDRLATDEGYKALWPLLKKFIPLANYYKTTANEQREIEMAKALLIILAHLKVSIDSIDEDPQELIDDIANQAIPEEWLNTAKVKSDSYDFVQKGMANLFSQTKINIRSYSKAIQVPVILVVMNGDEAEELQNGSAFEPDYLILHQDFDTLKELLQANCPECWGNYGPHAKQWMPFGTGLGTIEKLVNETFKRLCQEENWNRIIKPRFLNIHELVDDDKRKDLRNIRSTGCIVILDIISMRHPKLQRDFHRSLLDAYDKTLIIYLAPSYDTMQKAKDLRAVIQVKLREMEFILRKEKDLGEASKIRDDIVDYPNFTQALKNHAVIFHPPEVDQEPYSRPTRD